MTDTQDVRNQTSPVVGRTVPFAVLSMSWSDNAATDDPGGRLRAIADAESVTRVRVERSARAPVTVPVVDPPRRSDGAVHRCRQQDDETVVRTGRPHYVVVDAAALQSARWFAVLHVGGET
jgi:hypothetical protein